MSAGAADIFGDPFDILAQREERDEFEEHLKDVPRRSKSDVSWMLKKILNDVDAWFDFWWNMGLSQKQLDIAESFINNTHTCAITSRQVGKTTVGGGTLARQMILEPGISAGIYAPSFNQAISLGFGNVKAFLEAQPLLDDQMAEVLKSGRIVMANGNTCLAQTANKESNIRGFSPTHIWIDECAFIDDETYSADILASGAAVKGLKRRGGNPKLTKILETTTPWGRNHLYKAVRPLPNFEHGRIDHDATIEYKPSEVIPNVLTPSRVNVIYCPWWESNLIHDPDQYIISLEWVRDRFRDDPRRLFEQEYCCAFNSNEGFAFNIDHIYKQCTIERKNRAKAFREEGDVYCAGLDLGHNQDHSVLSVFRGQTDSNIRKMVFLYEWDTLTEWEDIYSESLQMLHYWKPKLLVVDQTGIGDPIFNAVYKRGYISGRCHGWIGTKKTKMDIMRNLEKHLEDGRVVLWKDQELIRQLKNAPVKLMEDNSVKYPKPEDKSSDDRMASVALGVWACKLYLGTGNKPQQAMSWVKPEAAAWKGWLDENVSGEKQPRKRKKSHDWSEGSPGAQVSNRPGRRRVNMKDIFK